MRNLLVILLCVTSSTILAQLPTNVTSTLPPSIKWQQINSPHFKVLYTFENKKQAQHVTNILERIYEPASKSLGAKPFKFPVIIQNERSESNGFVTVGPFRSELYSTAPQNYLRSGNDQWLERLIAHEYRHIVQFQKAITLFNKSAFFLTGEYGAAFFAGIAAPSWFFEGDAVGVETAMGRSGRGVLPSFLMPFKANLIQKGGFHYYKQHLGSFRDFVPNHYVTGYLMTTHLKNQNGAEVWDRIVGRSFRYPFIPFTFSNAIKKETGKHLVPAYDNMMANQKTLFENQIRQIEPSPFEIISKKKNKAYTNYEYPRVIGKDKILTIKSGLGDIRQLVVLHQNGTEEKLLDLGIYNDIGYLSANEQSVVWTEFEFDPRWSSRNYLVIKKYDFTSGKLSRITKRSKYTSAAISKDGSKMVATNQDKYGKLNLCLLDGSSGQLIKSFENPENKFYSMPTFDVSGEYIISLMHEGDGKWIIKKSVDSGLEQKIFFSNQENIGAPVQCENFIYFNSNLNGIDNIFRVNIDTQQVEQVTNSVFGAFNASMAGSLIYYSDYTADGHEIVKANINKLVLVPRVKVKNLEVPFTQQMVEQEDIHDVLYQADSIAFKSKKYNRLAHSFRPVSWGLFANPANNTLTLGLTSRDVLSTTILSGGAKYNYNEETWRGFVDYSYQALYPIIDLEAEWGKRSFENDTIARTDWTQNSISLGLRVPFTLTRSRMLSNAIIEISSSVNSISGMSQEIFDLFRRRQNGHLYSLDASASYGRLLRRSKLDVQPRLGQTIEVHTKLTPYGGDYQSDLFAVEGNLYFPGLFKHHGIRLKATYQKEEKGNYYFTSPVTFTRGYSYIPFDDFFNYQVNYGLPLFAMDWHLGPFFNLQRIRTNGFYDHGFGYANIRGTDINRQLKSTGAEVLFSFNLMRYRLLFDAGLRYTYIPDTNDYQIRIVVAGVSF